jgi:hypothetical protein
VIIIILAINYKYFFSCSRQPKHPETTVVTSGEPSPEEVPDTGSQPGAHGRRVRHSNHNTTVDPEVEPPKPEPGRKVYYIVVGSFPEEATAKELALNSEKTGSKSGQPIYDNRVQLSQGMLWLLLRSERSRSLLDSVKEQVNPMHTFCIGK